MNRNWNRIELIGNLTHDPELRKTTKGTSVCAFRIATNRRFKDAKGEIQEATDYHRIIAWSTLGEQCASLLRKGSAVFVSGRLSYREYPKDDEKREVAEIIINDMILLEKKGAHTQPPDGAAADAPTSHAAQASSHGDEDIDDEIPF